MTRPFELTRQVRQLARPPRMSATLTRRVYLAAPAAAPAASRLLVQQITLSAPAADFLSKPQAAGQLAALPATMSPADCRAFLALEVLGELVECLFGVDLSRIALLEAGSYCAAAARPLLASAKKLTTTLLPKIPCPTHWGGQ